MDEYRHPRCYASALGGCAKAMSREHYVSESALREFTLDSPLHVKGFPWQESADEELSPKNLTAKILCKAHNQGLSELDQCVVDLLRALKRCHAYLSNSQCSVPEPRSAIEASTLERWMLKVLCGIISSGNAMFREKRIPKRSPPLIWLLTLFARIEMPPNWGLYWRIGPGDRIMSRQSFLFAPLIDGKELIGCKVELLGFSFLLAMRDLRPEQKDTLLDGAVYRPRGITLTSHDGRRKAQVLLDWGGRESGDFIRVQQDSGMGRR